MTQRSARRLCVFDRRATLDPLDWPLGIMVFLFVGPRSFSSRRTRACEDGVVRVFVRERPASGG